MSDDSYTAQGSSWRVRAAIGLGVVILLLVLAAWKGGGSGSATVETPDDQQDRSQAEELERQLSSVLDGLRPERLGVSVDADDVVDSVNLWWADYREAPGTVIPQLQTEAVRDVYGEAAFEYASERRFNTRDMSHIRNCLMNRAIVEHIAETADTDIDRAMAAFQFVVDNVELAPGTSPGPPVTPFEVLLLGRGRPDDRAWLLAEVLRQFGRDCVLIAPSGEPTTGEDSARLVGVIGAAGEVYLFDVELGLPIPSGESDPGSWKIARPATLQQARAEDALLRQFDVEGGETYPITAAGLAEVQVRYVSRSEYSASRFAGLQQALPAEFATTLVDPLVSTEEGAPGLIARVQAAGSGGRWDAADVAAWDYPDARTAAFHAAGAEDAPELSQSMRRLAGPRVHRTEIIDDTTQIVDIVGNSDRPLRYVRVQQLRGDLTDALVGYGSIRSASAFVTEAVNDEAREYSVYWIAVCQYRLGRYESSLGTAGIYLKDYQNGVWSEAARQIQAACEAELGRYDAAVEILEKASAGGPPSPRDAFLIERWRTMVDQESEDAS
ncbi:MAG: hypothetical protein DWQ34_05960 [Planctomycetota bacterium]|nr:MAG: hypothetical protein DWQ29_20700 [Planctomycetota bacterium]REJ95448.1 MAG: hypothetical protein DWQ34_05960 [Planctomycetota bacterium]REK26556.1 MAG: hypothetical protein DWQ41_09850 [Planctomycetota bacterium]REK34043.1 MAG: hypothetical protein DWQ45_13815 [Planctomycetota bacterium]